MGRSACIVGAGGGIGRAAVARLVADGYDTLILMDRPGAAAGLEKQGTIVEIDLRDPLSVAAAFGKARGLVPRIDALVCLSGVVDNAKVATLTLERWNEVLATNLTGVFLCCREAFHWVADAGRIVLTSSLAARSGGVLTGTAYVVAKAGVEGLVRSLANELAPRGVTVNGIAPGIIDTPMLDAHTPERKAGMAAATPLRRMGSADEVAAAVSYLLSEGAGYVTGEVLSINGGLRMD